MSLTKVFSSPRRNCRGTVDGTLNPIYNTNYFYKTLLWNGTQWNAIA